MDGLSAATTVISVLQTAWQVIEYVKAVKGAGDERQKLLSELIRARGLLVTLNDMTEDVRNDEWSQALQSLDGSSGPLFAFKVLLEEIMDEMGIKRAPKQAPKTPQSAPSVTVWRSSKFLSFFQRNSSSASSSITQTKHLEAIEPPPNERHWNVQIKLDTAILDLKWPFTLPRLKELLHTLERIKTHFLVALSSDNVRLSKSIRNELRSVHGDVLVIKDDTTAILEHQEGSKRWTCEQQLIFQSISTTKFSSRERPEELERVKQSAGWLLRHYKFDEWRTHGRAFLLSGGPGSGKTSLCKVVENFLKSSNVSSEVCVVAIQFSFYDQPENKSLQAVLAFIVEQILKLNPRFQKYYNKLMLTGEGPLEVADSLRLIHRARQDFQHFYIVLDALDECDPQQAQEVVEKLTSLHTPLTIFATSRPSSLAQNFHYMITIEEEGPSREMMKAYIQEALAGLPIVKSGYVESNGVEFNRAVNTISTNSHGIFLVAIMLLEQLHKASTRHDFQRIIDSDSDLLSQTDSLAQKIDKTYALLLQQLASQETGDAKLGKRVLKELLSADHPISTEELLDAVADDAGWVAGDRSGIEERAKRCVKCCKQLVQSSKDGTIQFIHITFKDFLNQYGIPD